VWKPLTSVIEDRRTSPARRDPGNFADCCSSINDDWWKRQLNDQPHPSRLGTEGLALGAERQIGAQVASGDAVDDIQVRAGGFFADLSDLRVVVAAVPVDRGLSRRELEHDGSACRCLTL
jgi:hypothetical protein